MNGKGRRDFATLPYLFPHLIFFPEDLNLQLYAPLIFSAGAAAHRGGLLPRPRRRHHQHGEEEVQPEGN